MRGAIGRRINPPNRLLNSTIPSSSFSSASGRGSGRGRGSGPSTPFQFTAAKPTVPGQPESDSDYKPESSSPGLGHGRGRPPAPSLPSFDSFISAVKSSSAGRGKSVSESDRPFQQIESTRPGQQPNLPSSITRPVSHGAGRGKLGEKQSPPAVASISAEEVNRHIRSKTKPVTKALPDRPKMTKEEAVKHAMKILAQGDEGEEISGRGPGSGLGGRGRDRGRGVRGRGRGGDFRGREMEEDDEEDFASSLFLGNNADGEKLAERLGEENMDELVEGFEEISSNVLPSPMEDAYIDALHTNYMV